MLENLAMNDQQFDELLACVQDMGKHMRGESVSARVRRAGPMSALLKNLEADSEALAVIQSQNPSGGDNQNPHEHCW